jgi:ubiquinone/menaquinone biosynthesis C-methylase UbiE
MTKIKTKNDLKGIKGFPYLHGFSKKEQARLIRQAEFGEHIIFQDVDFRGLDNILEVGCGVGAQSEILLRRFPKLHITGIDLNEQQLLTFKKRLGTHLKPFSKRYTLKKMNAQKMDFASHIFDGAFLCWVLEHIPKPEEVLVEIKRVLKPQSPIVISEVMNSAFFLDPYSPYVWKFWMAYNDFQIESQGDPFVGAKLGNLLACAGYTNIQTKIKVWHYDRRHPLKRKEIIEHWSELLLSSAPQLIANKRVTEHDLNMVKKELKSVSQNPDAVFFDGFIQAHATSP